jgi:F0F1-type ATP synthase assembly protein I
MSLIALGWLFTLGVLAHNAEEAVALPGWAAANTRWRVRVGASAFRFAAAVQSLLLIMLTVVAFIGPAQGIAAYVFTGYVFAMVVNVFAPHLIASLVLRRYMPGTATALLFNLPLGVLFIERALAEGFVAWGTLVWAAPVTALGILLSIPVLFAAGRWFTARSV